MPTQTFHHNSVDHFLIHLKLQLAIYMDKQISVESLMKELTLTTSRRCLKVKEKEVLHVDSIS